MRRPAGTPAVGRPPFGAVFSGDPAFAAAVFAAAFALRVVLAWRAGFFTAIEPDEMVKIAYSLAATGRFADPYLIPTGPTAHTMPVYPLFLALVFKTFGAGVAGESVKIVAACAASALRCALLPLFSRALRIPPRAGRIAAAISVFYVSALQTEVRGSWDHPWLALGLMGLTWMTIRIWRSGSWRASLPWPYGAAWGLAILSYASFIPLLVCLLIIGASAAARQDRGRYVAAALATLVCAGIVVSPWALRNYRELGKPIVTRSNLGLELWLSNGPGAAFDVSTNLGWRRPHPSTNREEAERVARMGEAAYNEEKLRAALAWMAGNPAEFARLSLRRFAAWWFPPAPPAARRIFSAALTILAFAGLYRMFLSDRVGGSVLLATWMSLPLIYYFIQWSTKYRFPMEWELVLTASIAIDAAWDWARNRRPFRPL